MPIINRVFQSSDEDDKPDFEVSIRGEEIDLTIGRMQTTGFHIERCFTLDVIAAHKLADILHGAARQLERPAMRAKPVQPTTARGPNRLRVKR